MNNKMYIDVIAQFSKEGRVTPRAMVDKRGNRYDISQITTVIPAVNRKNGGTRYTCYVGRQVYYLFLEDNRWFLETQGAYS